MTTNNSINNLITQTNTTTGSGAMVGDTSPIITFPSITGVSNNGLAGAGVIGELMLTTASSITITNNTPLSIGSQTLTAGDWDVNAYMSFSIGTSGSYFEGGISTVNNTLPNSEFTSVLLLSSADSFGIGLCCLKTRINVSGSTTVYAVVKATFTGTSTASVQIYSRRAR